MQTDAAGVIWGHSPLLGLDLCWDNARLRFYDPASQEYLLDQMETADRIEAESAARIAAEAEVQRLREELRRYTAE